MPARRIAIWGGTFDPVHHGHLRMALELKQLLGATEMRLVPAAVPPHRALPAVGNAERLAMLQLAVAGDSGLLVDDRELRRGGHSYTVDTLRDMRATEAGVNLVLCLGSDTFLTFASWHKWQEIPLLANIVVVARPGAALEQCRQLALQLGLQLATDIPQLNSHAAGFTLLLELPQLDISATAIRAMLARGESARYLVPSAVENYIESHALYRAL